MKKTKIFRRSIIAAVAALSLAVPMTVMPFQQDAVYAEATTYKAYQVFKGTYSDGALGQITWGDDIDSQNVISNIKNLDVGGQKPFASVESADDIAKALGTGQDTAIAKAFAKFIAPYINGTGDEVLTTGSSSVNNGSGYYLVRTETVDSNDAKVNYILQVSGGTISIESLINTKKSVPTLKKKVKENTDITNDYDIDGPTKNLDAFNNYTDYNDVADYSIGEEISFIDIGTLPSTLDDYTNGYYYEIVDTLDSGFDYVGVTVENNRITSGVIVRVDGVDVTTQATITKNNNVINVKFDNIKTVTGVNVNKDSIVTVEYKAKLNSQSDIGTDGQKSKAYLKFSNDPNEASPASSSGQTPEDQVIVFTYELDILKKLQSSSDSDQYDTAGAGVAEFKIKKKDTTQYAKIENGRITGWDNTGTSIATDGSGIAKFVGLDAGTYTIEETKTPAGYNTIPATDITITAEMISDRQGWDSFTPSQALTALKIDNSASSDLANGIVSKEIQNNRGSSLPSTGGIGTTIFYIGGGTMAAVAGIYLITKKRMKNNEEE
ncbi:MAG: LPXTG cell wall anchor domain-containing protein [Ruminococcus sp.]|nr:LPXTG cell wall anchor domain-containing protein [Ruminococcus sp.]